MLEGEINMRDLDDFAKFVVDQLVSPSNDFIQRKSDDLFLTNRKEKDANVNLSVKLEDDMKSTKIEKTNTRAHEYPILFYHLLRTYRSKNKVNDDLEEMGLGNLKQWLQRNEIIEPGCLIAQRVKTRNEYKFLTEAPKGKNIEKINHTELEKFTRKIFQDWGGIRFNDDTSYYERVSSTDFEMDIEIIAHRSKFYAHTHPEDRYIYDSRVSLTLLVFANLWKKKDPDSFPLVEGNSGDYKQLKEIFENERKESLKNAKEFYDDYCNLIAKVSNELIKKLRVDKELEEEELKLFGQLVEMALFSFGKKIKKEEKIDFDSLFLPHNG